MQLTPGVSKLTTAVDTRKNTFFILARCWSSDNLTSSQFAFGDQFLNSLKQRYNSHVGAINLFKVLFLTYSTCMGKKQNWSTSTSQKIPVLGYL